MRIHTLIRFGGIGCAVLALLSGSVQGKDLEDIVMITHGPPDVVAPPKNTSGQPSRYGIGYPFQVSENEAGLLCNLRAIGPGYSDYENGTDVFVFDKLRALPGATAIPITRNKRYKDATTGKPRVIVKFPVVCGFWPLGAKTTHGSRHPGEGAGFGFCQALSFESDEQGSFTWTKPFVRYVETFVLRYDGRRFHILQHALVGPDPLPVIGGGEWQLVAPGLTNAIPDGDDLLLPLVARRGAGHRAGVCRLRWQNNAWIPVDFSPVGPGSEPSLIRVADGTLLFTARLGGDQGSTILAWRSTDAGAVWKEVLRRTGMRTSSPVSIHRTLGGIPFVAANLRGTNRDKLCFWTMHDAELTGPRLIRDCPEEFGPLPPETFWAVDHATSAVVRLADEHWHALLAYRIKAYHLPTRGREEPDLPQTGCYVEEILSTGAPVPAWRF